METIVKADGTTTCCGAYTSIFIDDGVEYCKACYREVDGYDTFSAAVEDEVGTTYKVTVVPLDGGTDGWTDLVGGLAAADAYGATVVKRFRAIGRDATCLIERA